MKGDLFGKLKASVHEGDEISREVKHSPREHQVKGAIPTSWFVPRAGGWKEIDGAVIEEKNVCIQVNGQVLARFMATPFELDALALGFLRSEGVISGLEDVADLRVGPSGVCVDVWLARSATLPADADAIRTAGCGGGVTFDDLEGYEPEPFPELHLTPGQLIDRYYEMRTTEALYPITRGVHASALCTPDQVLLMAEDVGRHNTLDKLWGKAMQAGVSARGLIIVTTGRISSEMLGKAAKMGVPLIASRTSPTSRSVTLARQWDMTLAAYIRRGGFRVYAGARRLGITAIEDDPRFQNHIDVARRSLAEGKGVSRPVNR